MANPSLMVLVAVTGESTSQVDWTTKVMELFDLFIYHLNTSLAIKLKNLSLYYGGGMQLIVLPYQTIFPEYSKNFAVPKFVKISMIPIKYTLRWSCDTKPP